MTAYAREVIDSPSGNIVWELRSVNHRYLELHFKLPEEVRDLEYSLREAARAVVARGKVDCLLKLDHKTVSLANLEFSASAAQSVIAACNTIAKSLTNPSSISAMDVLKWPGVVITPEQDHIELSYNIKTGFVRALDKLVQARRSEGSQLMAVITLKLDKILQYVDELQQQIPHMTTQYTQKITARIAELQFNLDQNRFEQELVYLLQKSDIVEEIERLKIHAMALTDVCGAGGIAGRKLDFLLQEMNREANTIASKSIATVTSTIAVELKVLIDQIKEQVQNLE